MRTVRPRGPLYLVLYLIVRPSLYSVFFVCLYTPSLSLSLLLSLSLALALSLALSLARARVLSLSVFLSTPRVENGLFFLKKKVRVLKKKT